MILLLLLRSLRLEEDPDLTQHLLLQLLRLRPPPSILRGLGFYSILRLFRHLYPYDGTLTDLQEIEGSAPPFLRRSFWGDYCSGYECRLPEITSREPRGRFMIS